jgi:hypothetical protein
LLVRWRKSLHYQVAHSNGQRHGYNFLYDCWGHGAICKERLPVGSVFVSSKMATLNTNLYGLSVSQVSLGPSGSGSSTPHSTLGRKELAGVSSSGAFAFHPPAQNAQRRASIWIKFVEF